MAKIDHLFFACSDLHHACAWFEKTTGVAPAMGGRHVGRGTWNALVALGGDIYLELIAPDPTQKDVPASQSIAAKMNEPGRLLHWAAETKELAKHQKIATQQQHLPWALKPPVPYSRKTTDGKLLEWELAFPASDLELPGGGTLPFLIDWLEVLRNGLHPSKTSPKGCTLLTLRLSHPEHLQLRAALATLGFDLQNNLLEIVSGNKPSLAMVLDTPKGRMTLTHIEESKL